MLKDRYYEYLQPCPSKEYGGRETQGSTEFTQPARTDAQSTLHEPRYIWNNVGYFGTEVTIAFGNGKLCVGEMCGFQLK